MGTESWGHATNHKAMLLTEEGTLEIILQLKGRCATETMQGSKGHHWEVLATTRDCAKKTEQIRRKPQAGVESNVSMITHLCLCQNWCKNISPRKTLKLCYNLPAAWILHHLKHKANDTWSTEHIASCRTKCMKLTTDGQQNT